MNTILKNEKNTEKYNKKNKKTLNTILNILNPEIQKKPTRGKENKYQKY
jgi:hypothetical protein